MSAPTHPFIFDRALLRRRRARAAKMAGDHDVLRRETYNILQERLADVARPLPVRFDLDSSGAVIDEEFLPFRAEAFDLITSNLSLHAVNDLPGTLAQIRHCLKPDGLFLAALIGGESLRELRACLTEAELAVSGGISPRLSPTVSLADAAALMQRAGFMLPVVDMETITMTYPDIWALMHDLRGMGETNIHVQRLRHFTRREVFKKAAELYHSHFAEKSGRITASFDIVFLHGWRAQA